MTLSELASFLKEEHLELRVHYSDESSDIVNKRTWSAALRPTGWVGGTSCCASSDSLSAAVERAIEMWRHR